MVTPRGNQRKASMPSQAAITIVVLLEKVMPFGEVGGRLVGLLMIAAGETMVVLGLRSG
jgi:predicted metal-binding membrane protein